MYVVCLDVIIIVSYSDYVVLLLLLLFLIIVIVILCFLTIIIYVLYRDVRSLVSYCAHVLIVPVCYESGFLF